MNKQTGIIKDYNGLSGKIESNGKEYLLLLKEIINNELLENGDEVEFIPETKENIEIARFIKKSKQ